MPKVVKSPAGRAQASAAIAPRRLRQLLQQQSRGNSSASQYTMDTLDSQQTIPYVPSLSGRPSVRPPPNIKAAAQPYRNYSASSTPGDAYSFLSGSDAYGFSGDSGSGSGYATPRTAAAAAAIAAVAGRGSMYTDHGSGSYGCTLEPSFACVDPAASAAIAAKQLPGKRYVSKLLSRVEHQEKEQQQYRAVATMDPHGLFTALMLGTCMARPELSDFAGASADGKSPKCGTASFELAKTWLQSDGQLPQIVYEYGGADLQKKAVLATVPMQTLLASMTPIVAGLSSIAAHAALGQFFFHRDIKPANIVYADSCSKLIDFGLSVSDPNKLYSGKIVEHVYMFYPPELDLYHFMMNGRERRESNRSDAYVASLRPLFASDPSEAALDVQAQYNAMKAEVMRHMPPPGECTYEQLTPFWIEHFSQKVDLFGVGIVVIHLINDCKIRNVDPRLLNRIRSWAEAVTNFNAFKRFTPQRAQEEWLKIWPPHLLVDVERSTALHAGIPASAAVKPSVLSGVWTRFKQWMWPAASSLGGVVSARSPRRRRASVTPRRRSRRRSSKSPRRR